MIGSTDILKNRRFHLRLGTACNNRCVHCTVKDLWHLPDRDTRTCLDEMRRGRDAGCDEIVFMRGEPTIRKDINELVREAKLLGYRHVQLQTNGRMLAYRKLAQKFIAEGVTFFEVSMYGDQASLHDEISKVAGSFDQTVSGLKSLMALDADILVSIPVISYNFRRLSAVVETVAALGAGRVQFNFSRPVFYQGRWVLDPILRLSAASAFIREAFARARDLGLTAWTEAVPFCHLEPDMNPGPEATEEWSRHVVSDLHIWHDGMDQPRAQSRPRADDCRGCLHERSCPTTWAGYLELFGGDELCRIETRRFEKR